MNGFHENVTTALMGCQLVEQELKLYITGALDLVRKRLEHRLRFKMHGEDYEDSALERLIDTFNKLTNNEQLVKDLRAFKKERNYLSHKGIAHCLDPDDDLMDAAMEDFSARLERIQAEARRLRIAIHEEGNNFLGYLVFEDT